MFIAECILVSQHMALLNFSFLWKYLLVFTNMYEFENWLLWLDFFFKPCCLEAIINSSQQVFWRDTGIWNSTCILKKIDNCPSQGCWYANLTKIRSSDPLP